MIKPNKQIIDVFKSLFEEIVPVVIEEGKKAIDEITKNTKEQVNEFIEELNTEKEVDVDFREIELLNSSKLITLAKEPYENVFLLISEIQQQANQQLESVEV